MTSSIRSAWTTILASGLVFALPPRASAQWVDSSPSDRAPSRANLAPRTVPLRLDPVLSADAWPASKTIQWPAIDTAPLLAEDAAKVGQPVPQRIGITREVPHGPLTPHSVGTWTALPDGSTIWTLSLHAVEAKAIRVHFSLFDLDEGASVRVRGTIGEADPYKAKGPNGDSAFWAAPTGGDTAYVEYHNPAGGRDPKLAIDVISHFYRDPGFFPPAAQPNVPEEPVGLLPCHQSAMCYEVDEAGRDAVGLMFFSGGFQCTGALLNDVDTNTSAGYFLTANHCISSQAAASSLTVYWFFQPSVCGGVPPSLGSRPRSIGAKLLANSSASDFSFLRFNDDPEDGQGFAAWTTTVPASSGAPVAGIHHPDGSWKRYSSGATTTQSPICGTLPTSRFIYNDWSVGITEGGSSGSPLFNANWEVIGQLYGVCYFNTPGCNNPQEYNNVYGRFSYTYANSSVVSSNLNMITPDDAYEDNDTIDSAAGLDEGTHALRLVDFDDYFKVPVDVDSDVTVSATFLTTSMDLDLFLLDSDGATVGSSTGGTGVETIAATLSAGVYYIRANKDGGWGGDYSLTFSAYLAGCTPPTAATAESGGFVKNRFISFEPTVTAEPTAIRVRLVSLQVPDPPNNPGSPPPDFSAYEGQVRWVGPPADYTETVDPAATFRAANLQCEPYYTDWSTVGLIHVYGAEVVPSSEYEIAAVGEGCDPANESIFSAPLIVLTGMWGDIAESFQAPAPADRSQPDFADVSALVNKFKSAPGAPIVARAKLQPDVPDLTVALSFSDISVGVDAFKGKAYFYSGPSPCP